MVDDNFFVIERSGHKGRIKLGPEAKYWAKENGMTLAEMARYLLAQNSDESEASVEGPNAPEVPSTAVAESDFLPDITPSENIEDRRQAPEYVPDATMKQLWGAMPHNVAPQVRTFGPNPLANALGFGDVGRAPAPAPQVLGPYQPQWPAAFGNYGPMPFE